MDELIRDTIDVLTSIRSTSSERTSQLIALERNLASLVLKGKASEAEFEYMVRQLSHSFELLSTILLAHLRTFVRPARDIPSDSCTEISITLSVLQGLSLLDGGCKRGVSTTAAMEILLELLNLSVLRVHTEDMALVAADVLDAMLCVIAGSTSAIRTLEHLKGLECIVRVLRRKGVDPAVRVKSLELLYFYLLPEKNEEDADTNRDTFNSHKQPINKAIKHLGDVPYSPRSPLKKHKSSYSIDTARRPSRLRYISYGGGSSGGSGNGSEEGQDSRRRLAPTHTRSQSDLKSGLGLENIPPVPPIPQGHDHGVAPPPLPKTPEKKRIVPSSRVGTPSANVHANANAPRTPRTPRINGEVRIPPPLTRDSTRSVDEKKVILGNWLGNVDALVRGMREAGVWRS